MLKTFLLLSIAINCIKSDVLVWNQCGGENYTGDKKCASGLQCIVINQWYSQCVPSGQVTQATVAKPQVTQAPAQTTKAPTSTATGSWGKRFLYGTDYQGGKNYNCFDYVTIWIGTIGLDCQYNRDPKCTDFNEYYQGAMLKEVKQLNKIPVFYAYIIPFEARNLKQLKDCDMGTPSLCQEGANFIRQNRARIIERYNHHTSNIARVSGKTLDCVFLIEPDFWQYYGDHSQVGGGISGADMRKLFDEIVAVIKTNLPNAKISWDISAWIGTTGMTTWWGFFKDSKNIDFVHTSGGQGRPDLDAYKPNELKWKEISQITGKKIIADSGYGVGGGASSNTNPWFSSTNLDNRKNDGVISVTLANTDKCPTYRPTL